MNRSYSSLFALSIGDAYGEPFENRGLWGHTFDFDSLPKKITGKITDDSIMAALAYLVTTESGMDIETLKKSYKKWAETDGAIHNIGIQTEDALLNGKLRKDGQGNGALMRTVPYALKLYEFGFSKEEIYDFIKMENAITHPNEEVSKLSFLFFNIALDGNLKPLYDPFFEDVVGKFEKGYTAWMYHSAFIVVETIKRKFDFINSLRYIVSQGGDTDTNCAIFGAIYGANRYPEIDFYLDIEEIKNKYLVDK